MKYEILTRKWTILQSAGQLIISQLIEGSDIIENHSNNEALNPTIIEKIVKEIKGENEVFLEEAREKLNQGIPITEITVFQKLLINVEP